MSMCLLEVAMCEKCRSSHFQSEGGESKKFEDRGGGGGLKNFRTGGLPIWGVVTFAGGGRVSTPLHATERCQSSSNYKILKEVVLTWTEYLDFPSLLKQ